MYRILRFKRYYLVVNTEGKYENHTHIKVRTRTGEREYHVCKRLVHMVENKLIPDSNYLLESAIRITLNEEYKAQLINVKERRKQKKLNRIPRFKAN